MPAVKGVGEPCAGEPHARFDGRELETEQAMAADQGSPRETAGPEPGPTYSPSPRQLPTRPTSVVAILLTGMYRRTAIVERRVEFCDRIPIIASIFDTNRRVKVSRHGRLVSAFSQQ
jgi:hypothetical protein